ncbi:class I fructose-bisphosphate aldolase [uncultured Ilumatobacter sp.]|uniref:class I fructose-bisphosphate aldolase n=1 Tax=uncultured Ilumatobacter sp. TaxID=879968 RepID=UPI00374E95EF
MIITDEAWRSLLETRATAPGAIATALAARTTRPLLAADGNTFIIAIDHPARGMVGLTGQPFVMADRRDVLERTMTALADPGVDGVMATPDILDDLALLGALDGKVAVGSINRSGLLGSAWELDDQLTGHTVQSIVDQGLDGAKMLLRIDLEDERSRPTIEACARWITELAAAQKLAMLEPLPYTTDTDGRKVLDPDEDALVKCVGIANALGASSAYTWLKLPATAQIERVMAATSMPGLILGGTPGPNPETAFDEWRRAMDIPNVRGLVVGRSLLYPSNGDVAEAVATAAAIVHHHQQGPQ